MTPESENPLSILNSISPRDNYEYWDAAARSRIEKLQGQEPLSAFKSKQMMAAALRCVLVGEATGQFALDGELMISKNHTP